MQANSLHVLLYQSRAVRGFDAAALRDILETAVARNAGEDVTGLLVYGEMSMLPGIPGLFVQWLEGPEAAVRRLFASIARDPRHTEIELLADGPSRAVSGADVRLFPAWAMAVKRLADVPATLSGFLTYARGASVPAARLT